MAARTALCTHLVFLEQVGSVVGQIAKLKDCPVVGIAGGADKCRFVVEELGCDAWLSSAAALIFPSD